MTDEQTPQAEYVTPRQAWNEGWDACMEYVNGPDWGTASQNPYPKSAPTPQTPDDVREAVARAIRNVGIGPLGPNTIEIAQRGGDIYMTPDEAMRCADAALSATRRPTVSAEQVEAATYEVRNFSAKTHGRHMDKTEAREYAVTVLRAAGLVVES